MGIAYYCKDQISTSKNHFERALNLIDLRLGKNDNKWMNLCKFIALIGLNKNIEAGLIGEKLTKFNLTPPNLESIKFRLNILYENTGENRFKEFGDLYK